VPAGVDPLGVTFRPKHRLPPAGRRPPHERHPIHGSAPAHRPERAPARSGAPVSRRHAPDRTLAAPGMAGAHTAVLLFGRSAQRRLQAGAGRHQPVSGRLCPPVGLHIAAGGAGGDGRHRKILPRRAQPAADSRNPPAQSAVLRQHPAAGRHPAPDRTERALRIARSGGRGALARCPARRQLAADRAAAPPGPARGAGRFRSLLDPAEQRPVGRTAAAAGRPARAGPAAPAACRLGGAAQVAALRRLQGRGQALCQDARDRSLADRPVFFVLRQSRLQHPRRRSLPGHQRRPGAAPDALQVQANTASRPRPSSL
jgi:hypothetical protein